ncbi:MAG: hypothetical protein Q7S71_04815 [Candidatus Nitrotoga sp.]|nr:hypothetical protein [Candidatus Nitrotoga sp.]
MRTYQLWLKQITKLGLILMMGVSMSADAGLFGFGGTSWKEEVLLHDGQKIIVKRSVDRGGRHEIGQQPPIKEQSLTFSMPKTDERITWKSEFSEDIGLADFQPLLLDIFQGTAYVVTHPVGCLSYNKWGRPNPPYVIFKYQNKVWQRITIQELPTEIKTPNIIFGSPDNHAEKIGKSLITAETIQGINSTLTQPEYKTILREAHSAHPDSQTSCPVPSNAAAKLIAPEVDGKPLYYNWWPLAQDWLNKMYGKNK